MIKNSRRQQLISFLRHHYRHISNGMSNRQVLTVLYALEKQREAKKRSSEVRR